MKLESITTMFMTIEEAAQMYEIYYKNKFGENYSNISAFRNGLIKRGEFNEFKCNKDGFVSVKDFLLKMLLSEYERGVSDGEKLKSSEMKNIVVKLNAAIGVYAEPQ